jgi:proton-coupled amino acid transporter
MIGFSFYCFEGIGVVLPIMEQTKDRRNFGKILSAALITLAFIFSAFGFLCYRYFGHQDEKFVIYNFVDDPVLKTTELLFCVNLIFSYPLCIYPTNKIIESFVFYKLKEVTTLRKWLKNLSRTIVVFLGCYFSILFREYLD